MKIKVNRHALPGVHVNKYSTGIDSRLQEKIMYICFRYKRDQSKPNSQRFYISCHIYETAAKLRHASFMPQKIATRCLAAAAAAVLISSQYRVDRAPLWADNAESDQVW
jgi:hypothetical protein